jgi:formylglycine-generating enzyme required for sulfatase activity
LYYGRVRAKVAKLAGSSSYKITSPSLVAGVRGTDFGCDLIAVRPRVKDGTDAGASPVMSRVFCFEGSVSVSEADGSADETILIEKNEMVEKLVVKDTGTAPAAVPVLQKKTLDVEVTEFWKGSRVSSDMVGIEGGTFVMGSPASETNRKTDEGARTVSVGSFYMERYETTQEQWTRVMNDNPSMYKGPKLPVENVTWYQVIVYCNKKSMLEGLQPCYSIQGNTDPDSWIPIGNSGNDTWGRAECNFDANGYRLPTEAEWEFACRAGTETPFNTGTNLNTLQANYDGRYYNNKNTEGDFPGKTLRVGTYSANAFGLFDMHGNVAEWCWDRYADYTGDNQTNPSGGEVGELRTVRGGSWNDFGHLLRSAGRKAEKPGARISTLGFRTVCRP